MTTVDSWPKTLHMTSAPSWNSTTETRLCNFILPDMVYRSPNEIPNPILHWQLTSEEKKKSMTRVCTLTSLINKHARLFFSRKKSTLLTFIWGHFIGKQHQILPIRLSNLKKKFQPIRLFQPTCLLESWESITMGHVFFFFSSLVSCQCLT